MTATLIDTEKVTITLEGACDHGSCSEMAWKMWRKLDTPNYTQGVSLMPVPESRAAWEAEHRTARKRAWRCERLGYLFAEADLSRFNEDVYAINTSLGYRQGRPMSEGYLRPVNRGPLPDYPCDRHRIHTYGVLKDDRLRAYMTLYRIGDLALVSMILGHGAHLADDIMYLLAAGMVEQQAGQGGWFYYNVHSSGTDGLRYYKERIGFRATDIEWAL